MGRIFQPRCRRLVVESEVFSILQTVFSPRGDRQSLLGDIIFHDNPRKSALDQSTIIYEVDFILHTSYFIVQMTRSRDQALQGSDRLLDVFLRMVFYQHSVLNIRCL